MPSGQSEWDATIWHLVVRYWERTLLGSKIIFWKWTESERGYRVAIWSPPSSRDWSCNTPRPPFHYDLIIYAR
jgi:hypothetical protein